MRPIFKLKAAFESAFTCILLVASIHTASAQESTDSESTTSEKITEFHETWSERTLHAADWLDGFFGNQRIDDDAQQTRVKVKLGYRLVEGDSDEVTGKLSAKLSLPRLDERWSLIVNEESDDDDDNTLGDDSIDDDVDSRSLAVRYNPENSTRKNLSYDLGLGRPDGSYEPYVRARYRITTPYDTWVSRLDNKLYYYWDFGAEYDGKLDFDREIASSYLFRYRTRVRWYEDDDECNGGFCPEQHVYLYQKLNNPRHAIVYQASSYFQTDPDPGYDDHLDIAYLQVRYRHETSFDWLFVELRPRLSFERSDDYDGSWSFLVQLEGIFGYKPEYSSLDFGPEKNIKTDG